MTKTIVILTNSVRTGGNHCVAGREFIRAGGSWTWGKWIRPVSRHGEGELENRECRYADGNPVSVLDLVEVSLAEKQECAHQPENYFIDSPARWRRRTTMPKNYLSDLVETPAHLWHQDGVKSDRIYKDKAVGSLTPFQSLYLIKPQALCFRIEQEYNDRQQRKQKRRRAIFVYRSRKYDLPITDPTMDARYFSDFPDPGSPPRDIRPSRPDDFFLVVSLAAPFRDGNCYKIAATLLEP